MQTPLSTPIVYSTTIGCFEVTAITDRPDDKTVTADVSIENVGPRSFILWEGDDYTAIGQWTDAQATSRVQLLINTNYGN